MESENTSRLSNTKIEFDEEQRGDIKDLRLIVGKSLHAIAAIYGVSSPTIGNVLKEQKIAPRGFRRRP